MKFSDWFVWGAYRYCYPCWMRSGYIKVVLETGKIIDRRDN